MHSKGCEVCHQKAAKIHITQIQGGKVTEFHICPDCAREHGISGGDFKTVIPMEGFPGGPETEEESARRVAEDTKTCPVCNQTYRGFKESGRLGCAQCYDAFSEEIEPLLRRIQAGPRHAGKSPNQTHSATIDLVPLIQRKREQLRLAVSSEDFEAAARLRDEIKSLEGHSIQ